MKPPEGVHAPVAVLEAELSEPLADRTGLERHSQALVLARLYREPMGTVYVPVHDGRLAAADLKAAVMADGPLTARLARATLERRLAGPPAPTTTPPSWSVVVCTRDRADDLRRCLASLMAAEHPPSGEFIVVDNAPSDDTSRLVAGEFPVRYVREDRPGLNWARSRGVRSASGDIVLFTDDDVVADAGWIPALLEPFSGGRVAAVTGLTLPLELEYEAQLLFERYGGFSRGFERKEHDLTTMRPAGATRVGAGANMAVRRAVAEELALFDAELDCGTVARTGGDAYAFYRLLVEGYRIVYTPRALNWHRHRRDLPALRRTLYDYSVGGFAYLLRCWVDHGDWDAPRTALSWLLHDHARQVARLVFRRPARLPWPLVRDYLLGVPDAPAAYRAARRRERELAAAGGWA